MLKPVTNCPRCGRHLPDGGVFEAHRWLHCPNEAGEINGEDGKFAEAVLVCANCGHRLEFRDSDDSDVIQIIG